MIALSYLTQGLFLTLLLLLFVLIIRFRKELFRNFYVAMRPNILRPSTLISIPIWLIIYTIDRVFKLEISKGSESNTFEQKSEEPYSVEYTKEFNFSIGNKYLFRTDKFKKEIFDKAIKEFLEISIGKYLATDFKLSERNKSIVHCPKQITYYDYNILIQYMEDKLRSRAYGIYLSEGISYYCYQDPNTTHNIIGKTSEGKTFSIYTLDDLEQAHRLSINSTILVEDFNIENLQLG